MPLIPPTSGGKDFDPIPEGLHLAICYSMVDIGVQEKNIKGKLKKIHEIIITWELPDQRIDVDRDGQTVSLPRAISKPYNYSLNELSTLYKDLTSWRGRKFTKEELPVFDLKNVLGKPCQLQVIHGEANGRIYANIQSIVGAPKGFPIKLPENPLVYFCIADLEQPVIPNEIPDWVVKKIAQSETWQKFSTRSIHPDTAEPLPEVPEMNEEDRDDVPF